MEVSEYHKVKIKKRKLFDNRVERNLMPLRPQPVTVTAAPRKTTPIGKPCALGT